jgi:type I restriction enzyme S subunit
LETDFFREEVRNRVGYAVNQVSINQKNLAQIPFLIAPLAEQKRLALALGKLLPRVHSCTDRLDKIRVVLKRFRQSVLTAACTGSLTREWRNQNKEQGKIDLVLAGIRRKQKLESKTVTQIERHRRIWDDLEENDSKELPNTWRFYKLNKLAVSFDYGTSAKSHAAGRVPVLRMGNLQGGKIDWRNLAYTSDPVEIEHYKLSPRTVLFNRTNSPELVGKTAIYMGERPAIFAGYLIRINPHAELDPEYLNICLNSMYAREFCVSVKTDGVSQSNINAQKLGEFEVPFCSYEEQREIVKRVTRLFALADQIDEQYTKAKRSADRLPSSLLSKAFRGELVATEAELAKRDGRPYESAEVLLHRIRNSREPVPPSIRMKRGKRAARSKQF